MNIQKEEEQRKDKKSKQEYKKNQKNVKLKHWLIKQLIIKQNQVLKKILKLIRKIRELMKKDLCVQWIDKTEMNKMKWKKKMKKRKL